MGDFSFVAPRLLEAIYMVSNEWVRPSLLFRPRLFLDGDQYCALHGDDLMNGCAGFGNTPAEAMTDFDKNWLGQTAPKVAKDKGR